ncbi:MAG: chitobiase/beta-hexosaminidase C-terminal domain-containing protein [Deltaproteobacteria bacterium]|nr:MAG: chitobiase/beta-hexosaminidase C-terminal domain-containing protein [Deltaproteobacteria bacterium]
MQKIGVFSFILAFSILVFSLSCSKYEVSGGPTTDTQPPTGLTATPAGGSYCPTTVRLSTSDGTVYYTTDESEPNTESTRYTGLISINEDTTLKFMAVDLYGNQADTVTEVYVIDSEAPAIGLDSPLACYAVSSVPVSGTCTDAGSGVSVITVQAGAYTSTGTSFPITLNIPADGVYSITAQAEDNCGNISLDTIDNVQVDTTEPLVNISSPFTGECLATSTVVVDGSVTEDGSGVAMITVQAGAYTATGASFPIPLNIPVDGLYTVTAQVEDNCGNVGPMDTVNNVRVDTINPVVGISSPTAGECITTSTVEVDGNVTENGSGVALITVQAGAYTATGTTFPITLNIPVDNLYTVTAQVEDSCGNISLDTADNVRVDTEAPTGLGASPAGGSYCATPVSVTLSASDGTIYYTLDGSGPTTGSSSYTVPINISEDKTLKFMWIPAVIKQTH